jgi:malonyl-CoA O-methyltransferase
VTKKIEVAKAFGNAALNYDANASFQKNVVATLAGFLPEKTAPCVLEIGCGTGFLTEYLVHKYPQGRLLVTDLSPEMVGFCRNKFSGATNMGFDVMDADAPETGIQFDVIATSMAVQWCDDTQKALDKLAGMLKPQGQLVFSTLGPQCLYEWRDSTREAGIEFAGIVPQQDLTGVVYETKEVKQYSNAPEFLKKMKVIGAGAAREGHKPTPLPDFKKACHAFETRHQSKATWHIVYGLRHAL